MSSREVFSIRRVSSTLPERQSPVAASRSSLPGKSGVHPGANGEPDFQDEDFQDFDGRGPTIDLEPC
jgi:hypothetical protein